MGSPEIKLRKETLGGVETNIIQFEGTNPKMPTVFYHPGIFGSLGNLVEQNIPRLALESGCSFLALNTIDQDPTGQYPPRHIDFDRCMEIIEQGIDTYVTNTGIIPILNSWGSFPTTLAIQNGFDIKVQGVLGIGATLNAHKFIRKTLETYLTNESLGQGAQEEFDKGNDIKVPFLKGMAININKDFFEAHDGKIPKESIIHVKQNIELICAKKDEYVTARDTKGITDVYQNSVQPLKTFSDGGHADNKEALVEQALTRITNTCKLTLTI